MLRLLSAVGLLLLSLSLSAQSDYDTARAAFTTQDYQLAVELARDCYEADSTALDCLTILASSASKIGDQATAKQCYHLIEKKDTANVDALIQLASIYEQQQQVPRAIKYYSLLNKRLPDNALYFRKNANLYVSAGDRMTAFGLYGKANELNSRDVITLKGLSELTMQNDQMELTDSLLRTGLTVDSMNIGLNYLRARSKYKQRQYDSVTMVFHKIEGQVDLNSYYNKLLGYAYLQIDSIDLAISKIQLALVDDPESEKLHYYLATAFEKQDNITGALEHFKLSVKYGVSPDLDLYHRNVARLSLKENDLKTAITSYKDAYKYGQDPVVLYYLATSSDNYYKDTGIAINYYGKYLKSTHSHPEYRDYAQKRMNYLKEKRHQASSGRQ